MSEFVQREGVLGYLRAGRCYQVVGGIDTLPISKSLGVSRYAVQFAIDNGCKTEEEIKKFLFL